MHKFIGTGVALITPFKNDFSVDVDALKKIVQHCISGGVNYLVVLGTTAETATLTEEEQELVIQTVVEANNKKLPLVLGLGGNNTHKICEDLQTKDLSYFDAILSVSPYYNKPTQEGIYQHYKMISEHAPLPIILYNVPGRTASNMLSTTVLRLANDFSNIIGVKEASGDLVQVMKIIQNKPADFLVISGDDIITLPMVLAGGAGVISVIGQALPEKFAKMVQLGLERKVEEAYEIHYELMDIIEMIFEQGNPAGIKSVFKSLGICESVVRLPLVSVNEDLANRIKSFVN
uniref:4-hydroxy-tetrahydrodipicolinate synthase n=1 Tax=Flavobacterium sp. TaxID=239 RepID=UPI00404B45A4